MIAALAALLLQAGGHPVEVSGPDAPEVRIDGGIDLAYAYQNVGLQEGRASLNGVPVNLSSHAFFSGEVRLRTEVSWGRDVLAAVEIGSLPIAEGASIPFATAPEPVTFFREAYVEADGFPVDPLTLRVGVQPLRFSNRYLDEAFFLDLNHSESAWLGRTATGTVVTADRDWAQPVGAWMLWDAALFLKVQAFGMVVVENGRQSNDESVYGVYVSAKPDDGMTIKLITTLFSGPGKGASVWTTGAGAVYALSEELLLAAEGYVQYGKTIKGLDKEAWAANCSVRYSAETWWAEAGYELMSGDDPDDGVDRGWQSYENENRFEIVQGARFGWDWDTNLQVFRGAAEASVIGPLRARLDGGWFNFLEEIPGVAAEEDDAIGVELDGTLVLDVNESVQLYGKIAWLLGSDLLEVTTTDRDDDTWMCLAGIRARF